MSTNRALLVIENGKTTRYNSIKQAAIDLGMSPSALGARLRRNVDDGRVYMFIHEKETDKQDYTDKNRRTEKMEYKTLGTRVCITMCPHKKTIKIGSIACQSCCHFGGINRGEKFVRCSFVHSSHNK